MNVICVKRLSSLRQVWKSIARHFIRRERNNGVCRYKTLTPINTSILNILKLSSYVFPNTFMYFLISDHSNCIGNILWYPSKTRLRIWKSVTGNGWSIQMGTMQSMHEKNDRIWNFKIWFNQLWPYFLRWLPEKCNPTQMFYLSIVKSESQRNWDLN